MKAPAFSTYSEKSIEHSLSELINSLELMDNEFKKIDLDISQIRKKSISPNRLSSPSRINSISTVIKNNDFNISHDSHSSKSIKNNFSFHKAYKRISSYVGNKDRPIDHPTSFVIAAPSSHFAKSSISDSNRTLVILFYFLYYQFNHFYPFFI